MKKKLPQILGVISDELYDEFWLHFTATSYSEVYGEYDVRNAKIESDEDINGETVFSIYMKPYTNKKLKDVYVCFSVSNKNPFKVKKLLSVSCGLDDINDSIDMITYRLNSFLSTCHKNVQKIL